MGASILTTYDRCRIRMHIHGRKKHRTGHKSVVLSHTQSVLE
jgi:hypothetical protein